MDEKRLFEEINMIKKLLAANLIAGKSLKDQVKLLSDVGFKPNEISNITGKNANLIRVTKFSLKEKNESSEDEKPVIVDDATAAVGDMKDG